MPSLSLSNARVILPDRELHDAQIVIENGRIAKVSRDYVPTDEFVDLAGGIVFPGFIDAHIHGAVGVDVNGATADQLVQISRFLASQGVTSWLPTLVPAA